MKKALVLLLSHALAVAAGFALGIYALPILTAPPAPGAGQAAAAAGEDAYNGPVPPQPRAQ